MTSSRISISLRERETIEALDRLARILETGRWPSGLAVTYAERRVIVSNVERMHESVHAQLPPPRRQASDA